MIIVKLKKWIKEIFMSEKTDFEIYLEKYCDDKKISLEEGKTHELVRLVKQYYEENGM